MISLNDVLLAMSNIPVDDPIAEIWGRGLQSGDKIIEYTDSLPITINANGDALLDYRIYGADGGVGVATENLFDKNTITPGTCLRSNGTFSSTSLFSISDFIPVENGDYLIHNARSGYTGPYNCVYDENKNFVRSIVSTISDQSIIIGDNEKYIRISVNSKGSINNLDKCMVVKGTTAPTEYQPYGYKLPMTVGNGDTTQTVPVYIGENQLDSVEGVSDYVDKSSGKIVRRIKEYTFTGEEGWVAYGVGFYGKRFQDAITSYGLITTRFSHFTARSNTALGSIYSSSFGDNCGCFRVDEGNVMLRSTTNFTTTEECKAYFKAQYDNGTPVKMWYIMTTPVEEEAPAPFPDIPTIDGTTVIDYDGEPKPSQMYIKYKGKG